MKSSSFLKFGLFAAALFVSANARIASAQPAPPSSVLPEFVVVSLTSFDPTTNILNPTFPVRVTLQHTVGGSPTHYRFSRFSDFRDARWRTYVPAPIAQIPASWFETFTPPAGVFNRRVVLHFQVRATNPKAGRPIGFSTSPLTDEKTLKIEPKFLNSNTLSATIVIGFAS